MQKIALIVGRFQPFHKGHLFLIKKALKEADKIIIGIGSANIGNEDNPIDFETRKKIIKAVFYKEKIESRLIKIVPLNDFFDDRKWLANLKDQVGSFDIALGNNEWTNNILKKAGHKVLKVDYYKRPLYEGWRIRKLIEEGNDWQSRVPDYLIKAIVDYGLKMTDFQHVVLGGTFDHFHAGHKALLQKAFEVGKKVTIGIATEELYKNKLLPETIESFEERKKLVKKFTKKYLVDDRIIDIISFSEFTGGADKKKNIDVIVVSKDTYKNALKINLLRQQNRLPILKILTVDDVLAEDGELISSERIRLGEIDRNGLSYNLPTTTHNLIKMPESVRPALQKPLGRVFKDTKSLLHYINIMKWTKMVAVGDIIVDSLLKEGVDPDVKVIDFRSRRIAIKKDTLIKDSLYKDCLYQKQLINKPGTINPKAAERLRDLIRTAMSFPRRRESSDSWLVVDGEEDLLTLPAILFAPLNSLVLYGHWQHGIIAVEVDEKIKDKVREIVKKFN